MAWDAALQCVFTCAPDKHAPLVLAVSGGVDSMVLMHFLFSNGYTQVLCCYIDHGLRPDTQKDWQIVQTAAKHYGFRALYTNIAQSLRDTKESNVENAARHARYAYLETVRQDTGARWILTAHHHNDQLEAQLMHFARGAGLFGLVGLQTHDGERHLLRPFVLLRRTDILAYAREYNLIWHEDTTNQNTRFARNRLRHEVIPPLEQAYPSLYAASKTMAQHAGEIIDFHTELVCDALGDIRTHGTCDFSAYMRMPPILQKHFLLILLRAEHASYTHQHIQSLHAILSNHFPSGNILPLTASCYLERSFDTLHLVRKTAALHASDSQVKVQLPEKVLLPAADILPPLHIALLKNTDRLKRYTLHNEKEWRTWHTSFKKWRMANKISSQEARSLYGVFDTEAGEVLAVIHTLWQYPRDLPLVETLLPRPLSDKSLS